MKHFLVIISLLTLYSCSKRETNPPRIPYFSFDNSAHIWFSDLKVNDTLKFLSNLGNSRIYHVSKIENTKEHMITLSSNGGGRYDPIEGYGGSDPIVIYDYDKRVISFERVDSTSNMTQIMTQISLYMQPKSLSLLTKPPKISDSADVKIYGDFDDFNGQQYQDSVFVRAVYLLEFSNINNPISFSTFIGASKTYNEVVKFYSQNPNPINYYNKKYTINEVWYDRKWGFVYFKDIYGQYWTRQN